MKNLKSTLLLLLIVVTSFACTTDDATEQVEKNDCKPYSTNNFTKTITGTWSEPNEKDRYVDAIVIPDDPGGGYVRVTLSQNDPDLRPALIVDNDFNEGGVIISGSSATTNNELIREAYFSVHPGMKYSLQVSPFFNAANYPVDYSIEWKFVSQLDCFEPNDVRSQAKKVLIEETIEAYAIAGFRDYFITSFDDNTYDWYRVEIDKPTRLNVEIFDLPTDTRITTKWFNGADEQLLGGFLFTGPDIGTSFARGMPSMNPTSQVLDAGVYYIQVHADFLENGRKASNDTRPIPDHFNKTYKMKVSVVQ